MFECRCAGEGKWGGCVATFGLCGRKAEVWRFRFWIVLVTSIQFSRSPRNICMFQKLWGLVSCVVIAAKRESYHLRRIGHQTETHPHRKSHQNNNIMFD